MKCLQVLWVSTALEVDLNTYNSDLSLLFQIKLDKNLTFDKFLLLEILNEMIYCNELKQFPNLPKLLVIFSNSFFTTVIGQLEKLDSTRQASV